MTVRNILLNHCCFLPEEKGKKTVKVIALIVHKDILE